MVSFRSLFTGRNKKNPLENYAHVRDWLPSRRPRFKNLLTREEVTLLDVTDDEVIVLRHCGSTRRIRKGTFVNTYKRIS